MSTQQADLEDEVETPEVSNKWGAQDLKKATSEITDTSQEERDDLKDADVNGLAVPAQQIKSQIKIKRDDINYFVEHFGVDKIVAETLLTEGGGDLYKTVLIYVGYNEMPEASSLDLPLKVKN